MTLNLLVLTCILCWAAWGIFDKKALEGRSSADVVLALYAFSIPQIPIAALILNFTCPGWHLSQQILLWTGLSGLMHAVAGVAYLTSMKKTEASYVLGITASYPLVLQFLAIGILGEHLVLGRLAGSALMMLGVIAIGYSGKSFSHKLPSRDRLLFIGSIALATVCWAVGGIFDKKALASGSPMEVYLTQRAWSVFFLFALAAFFKFQGHKFDFSDMRMWKFCGFSAACLAIGGFAFLNALSISSASYVIVMTGCYPLLMYLFAMFFLQEKFNRVRLGGIGFIVLGGILVQLTQSL